jgi:hypothetical protein
MCVPGAIEVEPDRAGVGRPARLEANGETVSLDELLDS